jgi:hypothetical protein
VIIPLQYFHSKFLALFTVKLPSSGHGANLIKYLSYLLLVSISEWTRWTVQNGTSHEKRCRNPTHAQTRGRGNVMLYKERVACCNSTRRIPYNPTWGRGRKSHIGYRVPSYTPVFGTFSEPSQPHPRSGCTFHHSATKVAKWWAPPIMITVKPTSPASL